MSEALTQAAVGLFFIAGLTAFIIVFVYVAEFLWVCLKKKKR